MYVIVIGKAASASKEPKIQILSINYEGAIRVLDNHSLDQLVSQVDPKKILVDQADPSVDKCARIVV